MTEILPNLNQYLNQYIFPSIEFIHIQWTQMFIEKEFGVSHNDGHNSGFTQKALSPFIYI